MLEKAPVITELRKLTYQTINAMKQMVWTQATMALNLPHRFTFGSLWHPYMQMFTLRCRAGGRGGQGEMRVCECVVNE